ncbi:MAG: acyl-CoA dehydrogenase family protein [Actinobacteria bacterium]|nr:acyl-CoA dehydrogenase family protein [Actinomycetota bacterium]
MDFTLTEEQEAFRRSLRDFVEREIRPVAREWEQEGRYPTEIVATMRTMGLFGLLVPEEYGGLDVDMTSFALVFEEIARGWMGIAGIIGSHSLSCWMIARHGSDEQKQRYLPQLATGERRTGIGLTEPAAGTDLQGIETRAVRDGDDYIVNGTKTWITNARHADPLPVLVKSDPTAEPKHAGMSVLRRINIAARSVGIAQAAYDAAFAYAQERHAFGQPIAQFQAIQIKLADMATNLQAARLMTYWAAATLDRGERADVESGMAKLYASEVALTNALESMRVHGGYGYSEEFEVPRLYRDAPLMAIGEGTNDILRTVITRGLLKGTTTIGN